MKLHIACTLQIHLKINFAFFIEGKNIIRLDVRNIAKGEDV